MNILVAIMCIIAVSAGVWGWWIENGGSSKKQDEDKNDEKEPKE